MKNVRILIWMAIAVLFMAAGQGFGLTQFKDGGIHNIDFTINDDVLVDYQAPGMQTTVNLLNGGNIPYPYSLEGYNDSRINISGGSVSRLFTEGNIEINMSNGSVGVMDINGFSKVNWSGATIAQTLDLGLESIVTIYGSNFAVDGNFVGYGEIVSMFGGHYTYEPFRTLTGILSNGDIIDNQFRIGNEASIILIPEPATLILLSLGSLVLLQKRRK